MAVDTLAKAAATVLERNHISIYKNKPTTMAAALSDTAGVGIKRDHTKSRTKEAIKRAKLKRERAELVKHLYSVIDTTRQTSYTDSTTLSDSECEPDEIPDCYDYELQFYRRKTEISRRTKRERALPAKEQKFVEFCRECQNPEKLALERGRKKAIRVKFYQCTKQMSRDTNRREQNSERKANIEQKLRKLGLKRREEIQRLNSRSGINHMHDDPAVVENFALRAGNTPKGMQDMAGFLLSLQFREVTPEDYEFLLRLDESVPTKTVSGKRLANLREDTASDEHTHEVCGVCMENYEVGQMRKNLPCGHVFHSNCIDKWLGQSSTNCPLDGLEI